MPAPPSWARRPLRIFLPSRAAAIPTRAGGRPQPLAQAGLFGGRLLLGQRGAGRGKGEVDLAIGGDQGGSIRMPAAYCGIYGMKPTHGLVPYTGVMPIESTIDHTGPMTAQRRRQRADARSAGGRGRARPAPIRAQGLPLYGRRCARRGVKGMKIAVAQGGLRASRAERGPDVDAKVRAAAGKRLRDARRRGGRRSRCRSTLIGHRPSGAPIAQRRAAHDADDAGQRHGLQLEGPLRPPPCSTAHSAWREQAPTDLSDIAEDHHDGGANGASTIIAAASTPRRRIFRAC